MTNLSAYPFLRLSFCFALGIVAFHYLGNEILAGWWPLLAAFTVYAFLAIRNSFKYQFLLSILACFLIFSLGAKRLESFKGEKGDNHLLTVSDSAKAYKAVIVGVPEEKAKSLRCKLEVYNVWTGEKWRPAAGLVNAYVDKEKGSILTYGDLIYVDGKPEVTAPPANPGEFDYKGYLVYNRIHHQQFVGNDFELIGHQAPSLILEKANMLRTFCVDQISGLITDRYARGVTLALVLGVKDDLDDELIQAFSATGAMHVLAVSGLHVGIIYAIVFFFLKRLGLSKRKYKWALAVLSVLILWVYAFLTGLSPSVLRAVTMFTFVAFGRALSRHSNIYNTLAASAMALLCYNPYLIMSVGFQLSYLAVFGIVYLQPKLYQLIEVKHTILDKIWAITCVSIAAQVATAPLSLLYFHQFPSYFLLSNLFIIPAAFIILLNGLLLLVTSGISFLATPLAWLLTKIITLVNGLVIWVSSWPGSTLNGIYLSILDTWLIYALLVCLILTVAKRRFHYLKYATLMAILFTASQLFHYIDYSNSKEFSVMNISNTNVLDFRSGFEVKMISDTLFQKDIDKQRFNLYPKRLISGTNQKTSEDGLQIEEIDFAFAKLMVFDGKVFLHLSKPITDRYKPEVPIEVDCLILGNNALADLSILEGRVSFSELIIDTTNSWYVDNQLVNQSAEMNIKYHSVRKNGYYSKRWSSL